MVLLKMNSFRGQPGCPIHLSTFGSPHLVLGKHKLKLDVQNSRFFIKSKDVKLIRSYRTKGKPARVNPTSTSLAKLNHSRSTSLSLKHLRLGHISTKRVIAEYNARGIKLDENLNFCLGCVQGKSSSKPINSTASKKKHRHKKTSSSTDSEGNSDEPIVSVNVLTVGDDGHTASQEEVNVRGPSSVVVPNITYLTQASSRSHYFVMLLLDICTLMHFQEKLHFLLHSKPIARVVSSFNNVVTSSTLTRNLSIGLLSSNQLS